MGWSIKLMSTNPLPCNSHPLPQIWRSTRRALRLPSSRTNLQRNWLPAMQGRARRALSPHLRVGLGRERSDLGTVTLTPGSYSTSFVDIGACDQVDGGEAALRAARCLGDRVPSSDAVVACVGHLHPILRSSVCEPSRCWHGILSIQTSLGAWRIADRARITRTAPQALIRWEFSG